jgi:hypothetical protein
MTYCGIEHCHLEAVCNLVVELMHNTVIHHVTVFTITDYSFCVLGMNQHRSYGLLENHWNQFSCSSLRFKFFLWLDRTCAFIMLFLIVWLVTLSSLISVQFRKNKHYSSIASGFWSLPNSYSFTPYNCLGAHLIKKPCVSTVIMNSAQRGRWLKF